MQHIDDPEHGRVESCARKVVAQGKGFVFGYQSFGDDSGYCSVAVKSADGQFWSLYYDFDVTGQFGKDPGNAAIWLSRCQNIEFKPGTIGRGSFFKLDGCSEAKDDLKAIVTQRVHDS